MTFVQQIKQFIPKLDYQLTKGTCGRIGIVGGSLEYTGSPYFASISALRTGADLVHVFCAHEAATVIKSYSPELIVHPHLYTSHSAVNHDFKSIEDIKSVLKRIDVLVIGPGLSRDSVMLRFATEIIKIAASEDMPLVLDADALYIIQKDSSIIQGNTNVILTPNKNEFERLCKASGIEERDRELSCRLLSTKYGGVTILQKGETDIIACGDKVITCTTQASPRRCGGQGDVLAGCLATLISWAWNHQDKSLQLCGYGASRLLREASLYTFHQKGRSMIASDVVENIGTLFSQIFEKEE